MKIKTIEEERVTFDDGSVLESYHETDCCEYHYLDFNLLKNYNVSTKTGKTINIYEQEFDFSNGVTFKRVDKVGILLFDVDENGYLINGYGVNNGYYSDEIILVYKNGKEEHRYDVTECQKVDYPD